MSWYEIIKHWDQMAFLQVHVGWANDFFDSLMPYLRNPYTWTPIYIFLLYYSVKKLGRNGLLWCLFLLAVFGLCDFTAASILKPMIARIRPCNDPLIQPFIRDLVSCGSGFSFPSAHSANHFGISFFIIFTWARLYKWIGVWALAWAFLVVFAQVYVGVHYPMDILGGIFLGFIYGSFMSFMFNKWFGHKKVTI